MNGNTILLSLHTYLEMVGRVILGFGAIQLQLERRIRLTTLFSLQTLTQKEDNLDKQYIINYKKNMIDALSGNFEQRRN